MAATDTTILALQRNWDMVSSAVDGVDDATLAMMPNSQSNPMNWLVWHMTRVADRFIHSRFQDTGQVWTAGGWHEKFGMDADAEEFGMGWSVQQVADWPAPSREVLMGYYDAVNDAAKGYIKRAGRLRPGAAGPRARRRDHVGWRRPRHPGLGQYRPRGPGRIPPGLLRGNGLASLGAIVDKGRAVLSMPPPCRHSRESGKPEAQSIASSTASALDRFELVSTKA